MLTLGSLFNGISGWILAGQKYGVETLWESEIEAFPEAVTKHHFPNVVQLGDITKLDGAKLWPVDIICAGSPCQDLSVAGKQEGLKGERSGLFRDAIRLVRDMRRASGGQAPRFFVWENVPGAFSSNKGLDFRAVLEEITEAEIPMPENNKWADAGMVEWDGGSLAWRVLDAQYWGVPQRRRRIFLVADFGGRSAGEILFERESVRGDSSQGGKAGKGTAAGTESGIGGASVVRMRAGCAGGGKGALVSRERSLTLAANTNDQVLFVPDKARSLTARNDGSPCIDRGPEIVAAGSLTPWDKQGIRIHSEGGVYPTLRAHASGGNAPDLVFIAAGFKVGNSEAAHSIGYAVETSPTLSAMDSGNKPAVVVYENHAQDSRIKGPLETCPSLAANAGMGGGNLPLVSYCVGNGQLDQARLSDKVGALNCMHDQQAVMIQKSVRRLTPTEAERLQGLEDGYTLIDDKTCSDTARYKALGNGMAMPCALYVMRRIVEVTT